MIVSPGSSTSASAAIVLSVISPAGTITQTVRGFSSFADEVLERRPRRRAVGGERLHRVRADVVADAAVAVAHQPPDDARAHPAEPDHPELHRHCPSPWSAPSVDGDGFPPHAISPDRISCAARHKRSAAAWKVRAHWQIRSSAGARSCVALGEFLDAVPAGGSALLLEGDAGIGKTALWQEGAAPCARARLPRPHRRARPTPSCGRRSRPSATCSRRCWTRRCRAWCRCSDGRSRSRSCCGSRRGRRRRHGCSRRRSSRSCGCSSRSVRFSSRSTMRSGSTRAPRRSSGSCSGGSRPSRSGVLATVRGRPVEAPFELDRGFPGLPAPPGRTALRRGDPPAALGSAVAQPAAAGARARARGIGREPVLRARGRARARPTARSARTACTCSCPRACARSSQSDWARCRRRYARRSSPWPRSALPRSRCSSRWRRTTVDDIELACRRRVLELDGDRIRFTHPLLAPVCYEEMPLHRRRRLHRRLADLDLDPEERARHLAIAAAGPDEEIAAALDAAAAHAWGRGAAQAAAELAERAIALTPPDAATPINRTAHHRGRALLLRGRREEGDGVARRGGRLREARPDAGRCALRARGRDRGDGRQTRRYRPLRASRSPSPASRADSAPTSSASSRASRPCEARTRTSTQLAEAGLALAEQLGDPDVLVVSLVTVAEITFWRTGRIRRDLLERAMAGAGTRPIEPDEDLARSRRRPADDARLAARSVRPPRRSARPVAPADRRGVRARRPRRRPRASSSSPGWRWRAATGTRPRDCATRRRRSAAKPGGR